MTIAVGYLSPEGVIFGADSTSTFSQGGVVRHYDYAQKIFEVGRDSTLGIVIWGLGGLRDLSYRSMIAQFAEQNYSRHANSVHEIAQRFADRFWNEYTAVFSRERDRLAELQQQTALTEGEQKERDGLIQNLSGGFCLGGNLHHDRTPAGSIILYEPHGSGPSVSPMQFNVGYFWGAGNLTVRMFTGIDHNLYSSILASPFWTGSAADLANLVNPFRLIMPAILPLRDAR